MERWLIVFLSGTTDQQTQSSKLLELKNLLCGSLWRRDGDHQDEPASLILMSCSHRPGKDQCEHGPDPFSPPGWSPGTSSPGHLGFTDPKMSARENSGWIRQENNYIFIFTNLQLTLSISFLYGWKQQITGALAVPATWSEITGISITHYNYYGYLEISLLPNYVSYQTHHYRLQTVNKETHISWYPVFFNILKTEFQ